jgi:hypothetical protein
MASPSRSKATPNRIATAERERDIDLEHRADYRVVQFDELDVHRRHAGACAHEMGDEGGVVL